MLLTYQDIAGIFANRQGAAEDFIFETVTDWADSSQPKGLFIPVDDESGELSLAIANGAIAAVWDQNRPLPRYTPNQFPILFTADPIEAVKSILQNYIEKLNGEIDKKMGTTNFNFSAKKLLNKTTETYDIAVMLKTVAMKQENDREGRE